MKIFLVHEDALSNAVGVVRAKSKKEALRKLRTKFGGRVIHNDPNNVLSKSFVRVETGETVTHYYICKAKFFIP